MKNFILFIVFCLFSFSFYSCGSDATAKNASKKTSTVSKKGKKKPKKKSTTTINDFYYAEDTILGWWTTQNKNISFLKGQEYLCPNGHKFTFKREKVILETELNTVDFFVTKNVIQMKGYNGLSGKILTCKNKNEILVIYNQDKKIVQLDYFLDFERTYKKKLSPLERREWSKNVKGSKWYKP